MAIFKRFFGKDEGKVGQGERGHSTKTSSFNIGRSSTSDSARKDSLVVPVRSGTNKKDGLDTDSGRSENSSFQGSQTRALASEVPSHPRTKASPFQRTVTEAQVPSPPAKTAVAVERSTPQDIPSPSPLTTSSSRGDRAAPFRRRAEQQGLLDGTHPNGRGDAAKKKATPFQGLSAEPMSPSRGNELSGHRSKPGDRVEVLDTKRGLFQRRSERDHVPVASPARTRNLFRHGRDGRSQPTRRDIQHDDLSRLDTFGFDDYQQRAGIEFHGGSDYPVQSGMPADLWRRREEDLAREDLMRLPADIGNMPFMSDFTPFRRPAAQDGKVGRSNKASLFRPRPGGGRMVQDDPHEEVGQRDMRSGRNRSDSSQYNAVNQTRSRPSFSSARAGGIASPAYAPSAAPGRAIPFSRRSRPQPRLLAEHSLRAVDVTEPPLASSNTEDDELEEDDGMEMETDLGVDDVSGSASALKYLQESDEDDDKGARQGSSGDSALTAAADMPAIDRVLVREVELYNKRVYDGCDAIYKSALSTAKAKASDARTLPSAAFDLPTELQSLSLDPNMEREERQKQTLPLMLHLCHRHLYQELTQGIESAGLEKSHVDAFKKSMEKFRDTAPLSTVIGYRAMQTAVQLASVPTTTLSYARSAVMTALQTQISTLLFWSGLSERTSDANASVGKGYRRLKDARDGLDLALKHVRGVLDDHKGTITTDVTVIQRGWFEIVCLGHSNQATSAAAPFSERPDLLRRLSDRSNHKHGGATAMESNNHVRSNGLDFELLRPARNDGDSSSIDTRQNRNATPIALTQSIGLILLPLLSSTDSSTGRHRDRQDEEEQARATFAQVLETHLGQVDVLVEPQRYSFEMRPAPTEQRAKKSPVAAPVTLPGTVGSYNQTVPASYEQRPGTNNAGVGAGQGRGKAPTHVLNSNAPSETQRPGTLWKS